MVHELLGDGYAFGGSARASYPGYRYVVAMQVKIEPFGARPDDQGAFNSIVSQLNSYSGQYAELVVTYELLDASSSHSHAPTPEDGTFLTYRMDFSAEYMTLPGQSLRWQSGVDAPVPPEAVPRLRVPITEHHLTWHRVNRPPWETIRSSIGCVNNYAFMGAAAETVLFEGATADREFIDFGDLAEPQYAWKLNYVFKEKAIKYGGYVYGWNHAFRSMPNSFSGFERLVDASNSLLYRTANFTSLFRFA
jgi:hypothetical protein